MLSTSIRIVLFASTATVSIPSRPLIVNVSADNEIFAVPESPAAFKKLAAVATVTLPAEVKRPFASTTKVGICVAPPYVPAETPVVARTSEIFWSEVPLTDIVPVASPETPNVRAVFHWVAVVALPVTFAVIVAAVKLPSASRLTIAEAVFAEVAASTNPV